MLYIYVHFVEVDQTDYLKLHLEYTMYDGWPLKP